MMKKKIVFFSKNMKIGGMEKALVMLLNSFDFSKYEITLILEEKEGVLLGQLDDRIRVEEYRMSQSTVVPIRKAYNLLHRKLWSLKNRGKYDFSCSYATYSVIGSRLAQIASRNSALYVHSDYYSYFKGDQDQINAYFRELRAAEFKHILFVSNEAKSRLEDVYDGDVNHFQVISNLIEYENISAMSEEIAIEEKPRDKDLIVFVGRLDDGSKNLKRLINSFRIVAERSDAFELWIVGGGPAYEMCSELIEAHDLQGQVKLLGEKKNPYPYIRMADCVILTSNYEGYPVLYNECLVLGTPIMTTIPVSDRFVDIREHAVILPFAQERIAEQILGQAYKQIETGNIDFERINADRLHALEELIDE